MSVETMAAVAGAILAIAVVVPFVVAILPPRQHDPQRGMAVGCLMMCSLGMLIPAGLLAWGHFGGRPTLVKVIFWIVVAAATYVVVMLTSMTVVKRVRQRRWERETPPPPPPATGDPPA